MSSIPPVASQCRHQNCRPRNPLREGVKEGAKRSRENQLLDRGRCPSPLRRYSVGGTPTSANPLQTKERVWGYEGTLV
ncbi:hypothetical protein LguiA_005302 [Lonicera macranthoides]